MDSSTKPDHEMDPSSPLPRRPVFCPICGEAMRFPNAAEEQLFLFGRVIVLQQEERARNGRAQQAQGDEHASTEAVSSATLATGSSSAQQHRCRQLQQSSPPGELRLASPRAVLASVLETWRSLAPQIEQASLDGADGRRSGSDTHTDDGDASQDPLPPHSSPNLTDAGLEHLDEASIFPAREQSHAMPAEDNVHRLAQLHSSPARTQERTESLPADRNDWDEYVQNSIRAEYNDQNEVDWDDFSSNDPEVGSPAGSLTIDSDGDFSMDDPKNFS